MSKQSGVVVSYATALADWFTQPLGQALLEQEQMSCAELKLTAPMSRGFSLCCGENLWQLPVPQLQILKIALDYQKPTSIDGIVNPYALPFPDESVDLIFLPHSLEALLDVKRGLKEMLRVLQTDGQLLILHFNAFSSWGLCRFMLQLTRRAPWNGRFLGQFYLRSVLDEMDCELLAYQSFFLRPPINHQYLLNKLSGLEQAKFGLWPPAVTFLLARKQVPTLTAIKPGWKKQRTKNPATSDRTC